MAELSNQLMALTVLAYLAAMICYAGEYAFGKRSHIGRAADRQLIGAGGPATYEEATEVRKESARGEWVGRAAVGLNLLGLALHLGTTVTRGLAAERMPWGNMYEYILSTALIGSAVWAGVLLRKPAVRHLGLFASLSLVVMLGAAALVAYTPVGPLVPALNSYWYVFHVSTIIISSGIFLVGVVPAAMFLIKNGWDEGRRSFPYTLGRRVGEAGTLERLTFRLHAFAFPLFTFGALIAGPLWAEASWGRYWGWDPKEVWAFISWIVYAAYLHARATPSVKRSTATWIAIAGFVTMLMNLFGVNLFFEGLHSYADAG
ncbi:c-type cytochrome biogenesis protein CcsB [Actinoplanes sp. NPDC023801]|uniref:c-type cytochrome biogenesis protein CcsB n=1 Tax=Actinoplanes sp. NPDC023801 TaxID=3154595 RepID=UPI0033F7721B